MCDSPNKLKPKWNNPAEVMKLMKLKKKALQARISGNVFNTSSLNSSNSSSSSNNTKINAFDNVLSTKKRKNPFIKDNNNSFSETGLKKFKTNTLVEESSDQTLFNLLHNSSATTNSSNPANLTSFNNILSKFEEPEQVHVVKATGETWLPIDWTLKNRVRLLSAKPFPWTSRLKISEEASGVLSFTRCLKPENEETSLDTSPNARFHQCSLFWQHPSLPWLTLFPRTNTKLSTSSTYAINQTIRDSLQTAWTDSFKSLFQLIRTRQCPYFYCCANTFTVLFRAAGINGFADVQALITPTTRGFRHMLKQEDIEFSMPLKKKRTSDQGFDTSESVESNEQQDEFKENDDSALPDDEQNDDDDEQADEVWLKHMGINDEDIKQINYTQAKIMHKTECLVDNSEQSLVLIEGCEVHAFYNFLINCKSATATTGPLAGIPPTLLAPIAFNGATLRNLKVRENKVHLDGANFYSLELIGPILPTMVHNLFAINPPDHNMTATFVNVAPTVPLTKVNCTHSTEKGSTAIFGEENLRDCGLNARVLQHFCRNDSKFITNVECLKYTHENKTYTWT